MPLKKSHRASTAKQHEIESYRTSVSQTCLSQPCREPGYNIAFNTSYIWGALVSKQISQPSNDIRNRLHYAFFQVPEFEQNCMYHCKSSSKFDATSICETVLPSLFKILPFCDKVLPRKLTWNLKIDPWKRRFPFGTILFRCHVSFEGCKFDVCELYLHLGVQSPGGVENLVRQMAQVTEAKFAQEIAETASGALNWITTMNVSERYTYDQKWCCFEIFWGPFGANTWKVWASEPGTS